ncbi:VCBS repeat-containing protein [Echinicola sp. CAU 1574]|uniref:VCBS repeat-containing protein n=1 Tax=Echinicola arenosa TaxID=2774144 RepID=A0ABR9AQT0_9BACT|nr:VCBS repeat-containing protein [Echinicola arenosa]MBD8490233.1 VCBS repeat-containing protein [Echinicola arenosa]
MLKYYPKITFFVLVIFSFISCQTQTDEEKEQEITPLFSLLSPEKTNITFVNKLTEGLNTNVLMYEYFYNGGGVAIGDLNGDGLDDIYFTGNMSSNKLYLNKGNMVFEDITSVSGATGRTGPWKTGVNMADVNGDGLLDIYVCYSGNLRPEKRKNQLFINEGNNEAGIPQFSEQAEKFNIASSSTSTQGAFFDFDNDGDLDLFLLNHNHKSLPVLDEASTAEIMKTQDPAGSQFFRNDNGKFTEITQEAGIQNSALSYGLGIGAADINGDGWTDLYICNDYTAPDYLYINNQDGTFSDQIGKSLGHTSHFSMGNDIADINNDGLLDLYTLDMLPEDNKRQKLLMAPDNYEKFDFKVNVGFHYQYMRNMLQVNNGNETFSEIGQLSGISNTDWSWSAQFADFDNDGWKDLYITNGYLKDYTNMDFLKFMGDYVQNNDGNIRRQNVLDLVKQIPSSSLYNYMFKNNGDLTFEKISEDWGLNYASTSNGAAYADLDNDGDLDLVVNNINLEAFVFENQSNKQLSNNYLKVKLLGEKQNKFGLGTKITLYNGDQVYFQEQMPTRGYQSSISPVLHFGLGKADVLDSIQVEWLSGKVQVLRNVQTNQTLTISAADASEKELNKQPSQSYFVHTTSPISSKTSTNKINDFKRQPLMVNPLSFNSPIMVNGDVNGDGLEDIFVGGGLGDAGTLFLQNKNGGFDTKITNEFLEDKDSEDTDATFIDVNGDGHLDLYVCSGGYANFMPQDKKLQDRIYINDGKGNLKKSPESLPQMLISSSCVTSADINNDGAADLFVGGRVIPGAYPAMPESTILINDGKGKFSDQTSAYSPGLKNIGLVTDAEWTDLENDGQLELVIVGEWMPVHVFSLTNQQLQESTSKYFDKNYSGWWNKLLVDDLNGDGKMDLVIGNQGTNTQIHASPNEPTEIIFKDFDGNGSIDPILCCYIQGENYPYVTRDELLDQIAKMRTKFNSYKGYADAKINDIFTEDELEGATTLSANYLKTAVFLSNNSGKFKEADLPIQAQSSPVLAISSTDYNGDGIKDLILCGNIEKARLRFGKYDANYGILLEGNGQGGFHYIPQQKSGFELKGDVRSILQINDKWLFGINQKGIVAYRRSTNI